MLLDERKKRILHAVVDDYINTAEPVGSRTIARKHELGLSSATIRNEMADLEDMGYLSQPHTSAGRVPSDKGYRFYVDELMNVRELTAEEAESIKVALENRINEIGELVRRASKIMSTITNYTSVAVTPQIRRVTIKTARVVPVDSEKALVIVVTSGNIIKNRIIKLPESISDNTLNRISNILEAHLVGKTLEKANLPAIVSTLERDYMPRVQLAPIIEALEYCFNQLNESELYLEGATNIFNFPEFRDVFKAREFLNVLDEKQTLRRILGSAANKNGITVQIGEENELDAIKNCSLVTATYSFGDNVIGSIGVLGPTRMEYSKVVSYMNFIRKRINIEINRIFGENTDE